MSRTRVFVLSPVVVASALLALDACGGEPAARVAPAAGATLVQVASAEVPGGTPGDGQRRTLVAESPERAAGTFVLDRESAVAVPVAAGAASPADRLAYAGTLRELAWAAERAGDAALAAGYRAEADALAPAVPGARVTAPKDAASKAAATRARRAGASRRRAGSAVRRGSTARSARAASERATRPSASQAPVARETRARPVDPPAAASPPPPRRRVDRVFARIEGWLGGRRRVDRSGP